MGSRLGHHEKGSPSTQWDQGDEAHPDLKEWGPGTSKQSNAFKDTCASPHPQGETLMACAGVLGWGLSTRESSASVPLPSTRATLVWVGVWPSGGDSIPVQ